MEVLGSSWAINNTNVTILVDIECCCTCGIRFVDWVTQLKESFNTATWVLWSSTIVTMGQEHDEPVLYVPLCFSSGNELVNHDLGTVSKVTKLSLPENKCVGVCSRISIFKPKNCKFWKVRIWSDKVSVIVKISEFSRIDGVVITVLVLVPYVGVSVRKCSSLNILAWKTDVVSFLKKSCKGKSFSSAPVDALASLNRL